MLALASFLTACGGADGTSPNVDDGATDASISTDASSDAGASDGSMYFGTSTLQLRERDPTQAVDLVPGQAVQLTVRLLDPQGAPAAGVRVDYALLGSTEGSTLFELYGETDAEGLVSFFVQAGYAATLFQVRITSGQSALYVPFVVATTSQINLFVSVAQGALPSIAAASGRAYAGLDCSSIEGVPPSAVGSFDANGQAKLGALSTTTSYAIVATATLPGGATVEQCVDGIEPGTDVVPPFDFGLIDPPVTTP